MYELTTFYFGEQVEHLRPESIDTHKLVWERYTDDWLRTSVSTYWYKADQLITTIGDPSTFLGVTFVNQGLAEQEGLELEAQMRLGAGLQGLTSYALQRATHFFAAHCAGLVNSPGQLAKLRLSMPVPSTRSFVSMEGGLSMGSRLQACRRHPLGAATTAHLTCVAPVGSAFELVARPVSETCSMSQNADPGSDQHRQDAIPQYNRTLRLGARWKLWAKP